jgi:hypothetical protein
MPLARYFLLVGGALLLALFGAGAFLPSLPAVEHAESHRSEIRIHSAMKLPERVVFDTSVPAATHRAEAVTAEVAAPVPPSAEDVSAKSRQAFAQVQPSDLNRSKLPDAKRSGIKSAHSRKAPRKVRLARQQQFDWFGGRMWW